MAAIDFPNSPTVGQLFTVGDITWEWTGSVWQGTGTPVPGPGVATGGTDGQVLTKTSSADYATAWENIPEGTTVISSATEPGDTSSIWYNTENGNAYIYYDGFWASISGLPSGVPAGGTAGQLLAKSNSTDYATEWVAPSALTLLASQTFTSTTSIVIDNVFSSTYNAYQIIVTATSSSATGVEVNYRVGGVNATTNYAVQFVQGNAGNVTGYRASSLSSADIGRWDSAGGIVTLTIHGVALAQRTYGVSKSIDSTFTTRETGHVHTTETAYDGLRIVVPSSTGEIRVYGMRN